MKYKIKKEEKPQSLSCQYCSAQYVIDDLKSQIIVLGATNRELWKLCQSRGTVYDHRIQKHERQSKMQINRIIELETQVSTLIGIVNH